MAEWAREEPLRAPAYAALIDEFRKAVDRHKRYLLASLIRWHVPVPWASWASFAVNYERAHKPSDPHSEANK